MMKKEFEELKNDVHFMVRQSKYPFAFRPPNKLMVERAEKLLIRLGDFTLRDVNKEFSNQLDKLKESCWKKISKTLA